MTQAPEYLAHDIRFHRTVAAASGNKILESLIDMVSAYYHERRNQTGLAASPRDLHDEAEMHRRIYRAVRARDANAAREAMNAHLKSALVHQWREETHTRAHVGDDEGMVRVADDARALGLSGAAAPVRRAG